MRLKYLDALRGFCIFLVLYWHVITYSGAGDCVLGKFIMSFMLPMFFFISALVGYKEPEKFSNYKVVWKYIKQKIMQLLIPTAIIYTFYQFAVGSSPMMFFSKGLYGYWFVMALFEVYIFYYLASYLLRKYSKVFDVVMMVSILFSGFVGLYLASLQDAAPTISVVLNLSSFFIYLPFFLLGVMAKKYEKTLFKFLISDKVFAISVVLYAVCFLLNLTVATKDSSIIVYYLLSAFVLRYLGLIMIFNVFYRSVHFFDTDNWLSRILQLLGKHSLDLYLLHYFFISDFQGIRGGRFFA